MKLAVRTQAPSVHLRGEEAAQEWAAGPRSGRAPAGAGAQIYPQAAQPAGERLSVC